MSRDFDALNSTDGRLRRELFRWANRVRDSLFLYNVSVSLGGTVIAQVIPLLVLPILSRLYRPETFALLALVMMVSYLTSSLATGFYEQAVPGPRTLRRARLLATIAICLTCVTTLLLIVILYMFRSFIIDHFIHQASNIWLAAIPVALGCGSIANIANYWLLRFGKHGLQSSIKFVHAGSNAVLAILLGLLHIQDGLLYAFMAAITFSACWGLFLSYRHGLRMALPHLRRYLLPVMHHYREFPLFGSVPALFNNLAIQWPLIVITSHYSLTTAGHFSITRNLLNGGLVLVSFCIGQVLLRHLIKRIHNNQPLWPLFSRVMIATGSLGIIGGGSLYFLGPWFFSLYLGKGWEDSGIILRSLSVSTPLVLMGGSLAPALVAMRRLRVMARWQLLYVLASGSLYFFVDLPFERFIRLIAVMECFVYGVCVPIIAYSVRQYDGATLSRVEPEEIQ